MEPVEIDIGMAAIAPMEAGLRRVRALRGSAAGFDRAVWRQIAGFGWLGLRLAESTGGAGLPPRALRTLAEALGERLLPEPVIAASLAARLLPEPRRAPVLAGAHVVLPAWREAPGAVEWPAVDWPAVDPGEGTVLRDGRLFGRKRDVAQARGADAFLVLLADGLALVMADAPGLRVEAEATPDGRHHAALVFDGTPAERLAGEIAAEEIGAALDEVLLAECAYLLGLAERAFALARPAAAGRSGSPPPFGPLISAADPSDPRFGIMRRDLDLTRSVIDGAADRLGRAIDPTQRAGIVSRAALRSASMAIAVTRAAAQLHGGLGLTERSDIGLHFLAAQALAPRLGSQGAHRARVARAAAAAAE